MFERDYGNLGLKMIVVNVELWPGGCRGLRRTIASARIWNDATGTKATGNFKTNFQKCRSDGYSSGTWKEGTVTRFPRLKRSAWYLLFYALADIMPLSVVKKAYERKVENGQGS